MLRLVFIACHPVLSREGQVALTLRTVGGLTTEEIARMLLVPVATVQQRIVRAKKTLSAAQVPFDTPDPNEWNARLGAVLAVLYLIFTPEVHGLVALMEFQASRFAARLDHDGSPILLADQDRSRWDRTQIGRGLTSLARADALGRGRGNYCLQAAIAQCHATASSFEETDWNRIVLLYEALGRLAPSPVVELNHAVAVSMATGPAAALKIVDRLVAGGALRRSHLLPSIRGELLTKLGRSDEAKSELLQAAALTANVQQKAVLLAKAANL